MTGGGADAFFRRHARAQGFAFRQPMPNTFGKIFTVTTWGESHGPAVGAVVDGCPPRLPLDAAEIQTELDRRRPGQSDIVTPRKEEDRVEILSGLFEGRTTGTPISVLVRNADQRPGAYDEMRDKFRPSHADYTYEAKFGIRDHRGGGRSSARETVGRVAAGAIARKLLALGGGVELRAYLTTVHDISVPADALAAFPTLAEIEDHFGCKPGYLGPLNLKKPVHLAADRDVAVMADWICGANEEDFHITGVNWGRDLPEPDLVADVRNVVEGDPSPDGKGRLSIERGIEVGGCCQRQLRQQAGPAAHIGRVAPDFDLVPARCGRHRRLQAGNASADHRQLAQHRGACKRLVELVGLGQTRVVVAAHVAVVVDGFPAGVARDAVADVAGPTGLGFLRPCRVNDQGPAQANHVGVTARQDGFGLGGIGDATQAHHRHGGCPGFEFADQAHISLARVAVVGQVHFQTAVVRALAIGQVIHAHRCHQSLGDFACLVQRNAPRYAVVAR